MLDWPVAIGPAEWQYTTEGAPGKTKYFVEKKGEREQEKYQSPIIPCDNPPMTQRPHLFKFPLPFQSNRVGIRLLIHEFGG